MSDHAKLIEEAERFVAARGERRDTNLVRRLTEALQKRVGCDHLDAPYRRVLAEHDALRARLTAEAEMLKYLLDIHDGSVPYLPLEDLHARLVAAGSVDSVTRDAP